MMSLADALAAVLAHAEPVEPIEISLTEAVGLVLAEPLCGDVDLPPFDRAARAGYAIRAEEANPGTLLHLTEPWIDGETHDHEIDAGEATRVEAGDPLPLGAEAILDETDVRVDPGEAPARVIEVIRHVEAGHSIRRRGDVLRAGSILANAGTRITPAMIPLFAAQGAVYPVCHRRVRVAILAVGDHLISPADAPVLHHERNAANLSIGSLLLGTGAMVHDLGAVSAEAFEKSFDRALNTPVVLVLGRLSATSARTMAAAGVTPVVSGVEIEPGGGSEVGYGEVRDEDGRLVSHVFHLPIDPVSAMTAVSLLVLPLIARLQGEVSGSPAFSVIWDADAPLTGSRLRAVPAKLINSRDGRMLARPIVDDPSVNLPDFAAADGLVLFSPDSGPWRKGEVVSFVSWSGRFAG